MTTRNGPEEWRQTEAGRRKHAADRAIANGDVLLTPQGAAFLFDKNLKAIAAAHRRHEEEAVAWMVEYGGRPVPLLWHQWAVDHWKRPLQDRYDAMAAHRHTSVMGGRCYLILHPRPIHTPGVGTQYDLDLGYDRDPPRLDGLPLNVYDPTPYDVVYPEEEE